ncbi:MAG TPA: LCP family protein [Thermaerobacter sp.]
MGVPVERRVAARPPRRKLRIGRVVAVAVLVLLGAAAAVFGSTLYGFLGNIHQVPRGADGEANPPPGWSLGNEPLNILVLGVDAGAGADDPPAPQRSDTIMVVSVDPVTGRIGLLSVPRDTRVQIPGRPRPEKIAHAHAYGQAEGGAGAGARLVAQTVENLLGIRIHHFVEVDFEAFQAAVDAVGGVEVCVEKPMKYTARSQNLRIDLEPGCQLLDGERALQYVRYRRDGDINRIRRQQKFVRAFAERVLSARSVLKLPQVASAVGRQVTTDMSNARILAFAALLPKIDTSNIHMDVLPGRPGYVDGLSYWLVDPAEARRTALRVLAGIDPGANEQVRVEVLNGNGRRGAASQTAEVLRDLGYQVVSVGNAERYDWERTTILVRESDRPVADQVRKALAGVAPAATVDVTGDLPEGIDVRVVVGTDFNVGAGTAAGAAVAAPASGPGEG